MYKVLFVCTGNICRSPTAEGVFRQMIENKGLEDEIFVDSAGTGSWHEGNPPDMRSIDTALNNGVDISSLRARSVIRDDFKDFDLIIALDRTHLKALEAMRPALSRAHERAVLSLMMRFAQDYETDDVPDPYFGEKGFQSVIDMINSACEGLLKYLEEEKGDAGRK